MKSVSPSVIASVLIPIGILGVFWTILNQPITQDPSTFPKEIQEIDQRLANAQPELILVGSSLIHKDIDIQVLATQLDLPSDKIQKIWSGMATMPIMSMMIENRILKTGLTPKVVAILAPPSWLLETNVLQDANFVLHQTSPLQPLLATVLGKESEMVLAPWKQRKTSFQSAYQQWNQQLFGTQVLDRSSAEIDTQLEDLFSFENQRTKVNGVQLIQHNVRQTDEQREQTPSQTLFDIRLLSNIAETLQSNSIHLVVVTLPVSDPVKKNYALSNEQLSEIVMTLQQHNASFIDLSDWTEQAVYGDTKHMNARGRKIFTPLLANKFKEIRILEDAPLVASVPTKLLLPTIEWSGKSNTLLPSEHIQLLFPTTESHVELVTCLSSNKPYSETVFTASSKRVGTDSLWCETISLQEIEANTPIQLSNTTQNQIYVHSMRLNEINVMAPSKKILAAMKEWTFLSKEPAKMYPIKKATTWPKWLQNKTSAHPELQLGEVTRYKELSDVVLIKSTIAPDCRPIEVLESDTTLPIDACPTVWKSNSGYCSSKNNFIAIQSTPIRWDSLQITLKEDRYCSTSKNKRDSGRWFYPGDVATTTFNWPKASYSKIHLEGVSIGKGAWQVKLFDGDVVFLEETFTDPLELEQTIQLHSPMLKKYNKVQVQISIPTDSNGYLFLRKIEVRN